MPRKLVSYRLADDLQQALKERASQEGISTTELVNRLLRNGLAEEALEKTGPATEIRLKLLEEAVHHVIQRLDSSGDVAVSASKARPEIESKLSNMEVRLEKILIGVEESYRGIAQLARSVDATDNQASSRKPSKKAEASQSDAIPGQDWTHSYQDQEIVPVSLEDLRKLLKSED